MTGAGLQTGPLFFNPSSGAASHHHEGEQQHPHTEDREEHIGNAIRIRLLTLLTRWRLWWWPLFVPGHGTIRRVIGTGSSYHAVHNADASTARASTAGDWMRVCFRITFANASFASAWSPLARWILAWAR